MEIDTLEFVKFNPQFSKKTYSKTTPICDEANTVPIPQNTPEKHDLSDEEIQIPFDKKNVTNEELTTKNAVSFLLSGTLKIKVCRYCLVVTEELHDLEKTFEIGSKAGIYSVTLKDMLASFHPFQVFDDPNFPTKICNKCVDRTLNSYLFTQQCEQSERALLNCFDDIYTKLSKLDPIEGTKHTRGRKKTKPNHNQINAEHLHVIDYADPVYQIVNTASESLSKEPGISPLECLKCSQVLPTMESLVNHSKLHPSTMWFSCRLCGKSFPKLYLLRRHFREHNTVSPPIEQKFECKTCGETNEKYYRHIQHLEKHKFKMLLDHLVHRKMDSLCAICFDKGDLVPLDRLVSIYGGPPDLMGVRSMQSILASTVPELDFINYAGSQICEKCVNNAITSYNFKNHTYFVRDRLYTCLRHMLDSLKDISTDNNLCIEISKDTIMPLKDCLDELVFNEEIIEYDDAKEEVYLEDEYRIKSDEESDEFDEKPTLMKSQDENDKVSECERERTVYINGLQNLELLPSNYKHKHRSYKFTCHICSKYFASDYFLKRHCLKHFSQNLQCKLCGTTFANKFSLQEHQKYAHVLYQSDYKPCNICGRGFTKENKLKLHEKQHENKLCLLCNKVFKSQGFFNAHLQRHKPKLMELKRKYSQSCSFCEKVCANDNQLSIHVNKVHLLMKAYSCDMCEKQFYSEYNLKNHKKMHSRKSKEKCHFCSKTLQSRKQLVTHIRKHIGAAPHACHLCSESYYTVAKLKKHMILTHGGSVICKICKHIFVSKNQLKSHVNKAHSFL